MALNAEGNVKPEEKKEGKRTVEVRCQCGCSPRGKLIAMLIDFPEAVFGSGAVVQVACPSKKSRLSQIRL